MIELAGVTTVDAACEPLWSVLSEPAAFSETLPNVSDVRVRADDDFSATISPETALGLTSFHMDFRVRELAPSRRVVLEGRAVQSERAVHLRAQLDLSPNGARTNVSWSLTARFFGPLAALGQRVLPDIVGAEVGRSLRAAGSAAITASPARDSP